MEELRLHTQLDEYERECKEKQTKKETEHNDEMTRVVLKEAEIELPEQKEAQIKKE